MYKKYSICISILCLIVGFLPVYCYALIQTNPFNVKDYGATGKKADIAQEALQKTIDACAASGGGMVYFPPGEYTTGTIHLRSHVRLFIEAGAIIYSIKDKSFFDKEALIYGEDLNNITIEGRGTIDGQGEYEWRLDDIEDDFIRPNEEMMLALGKPIMRSFKPVISPLLLFMN